MVVFAYQGGVMPIPFSILEEIIDQQFFKIRISLEHAVLLIRVMLGPSSPLVEKRMRELFAQTEADLRGEYGDYIERTLAANKVLDEDLEAFITRWKKCSDNFKTQARLIVAQGIMADSAVEKLDPDIATKH